MGSWAHAPSDISRADVLHYNLRMYKCRTGKIFHAWLACLAILFNALIPSISHALAWQSGTPGQAEICTVEGTKVISLAAPHSGKAPAVPDLKAFQHCAYCLTHAGSSGLLPQAAAVPVFLDGHDLYPPLFYQAPQPLFSWIAANPRAPPVFL
jgi:hypothetical protein